MLGLVALSACQTSPVAIQTSSTFELRMGSNTLGVQAAYQTETGLSFTPESVALACDDVQSGYRYIQRRFVVQNNTGSTLTNLQIHAYNKTGNTSSTALKSITGFGGNASPDATQALPRHGVGASCSTAPFVPSANYADLQLYTDAEITSRTTLAVSSLAANEYLLGYGYLVRQRASQTDADSNERTIQNGESGFVTIALRVPVGLNSTYNFSMTFLTFTDTVNELVQTPEDQLAGTTAGLSALPSGVSRVSVLGGAACGLSGTNRFQTKLILAKNSNSTVTDSELNTPIITTTVSSNADSGAGSLRDAITNAASGDTICFTQSITLSSELSIGQSLNILASQNVTLSGNTTTRVLNISAGTVNLYGFVVQNGSSNAGGGINNAATLRLFGMTIRNNSAKGLPALGGGVYSTGAITALYSSIINNNTQTFDAPPFGLGIFAYGGGVYLNNTNLALVASQVSSNTAIGGKGGMGMNGIFQNVGPTQICIFPNQIGQQGGEAKGGGVYRFGSSTVSGSGLVSNNIVMGGAGGDGGNTPFPCFLPPPSATGTTSSPNIF